MSEKTSSFAIILLITLFDLTGFGLVAFIDGPFNPVAMIIGVTLAVLLIAQYNVFTQMFKGVDKYVILIMHFLISVGMLMIYRINPEYAIRQLVFTVLGIFVMTGTMIFTSKITNFNNKKWQYILMGGSVGLLLLTIVIGSESGGATNWIRIAGFSIQPSELVKISLIVILAAYFANNQGTIKVIPVLAFSAVCMVLLLVQNDLGAVLLYFATTLIVYYVCTNNWFITGLGLLSGAGGAVIAYQLFSHVRVRVAVWQNPWLDYQNYGYQIVQGLLAISSGGLFGVGLGRGVPTLVPARHTDYIFAVIVEEFGLIFGMAILAFYIVLILRGAIISRYAKSKFHMILAFGCTTLIALQGFIIIAGVVKMIPLTGITMPFVSYGGSSLLTCMAIMGILLGVSIQNSKE